MHCLHRRVSQHHLRESSNQEHCEKEQSPPRKHDNIRHRDTVSLQHCSIQDFHFYPQTVAQRLLVELLLLKLNRQHINQHKSFVYKMYHNPQAILKLRCNVESKNCGKLWMTKPLVVDSTVRKLIRQYGKDKLRTLPKGSFLHYIEQPVKNLTHAISTRYDDSSACLKTLIGKIDVMVKCEYNLDCSNILPEVMENDISQKKPDYPLIKEKKRVKQKEKKVEESSGKKQRKPCLNQYGFQRVQKGKKPQKSRKKSTGRSRSLCSSSKKKLSSTKKKQKKVEKVTSTYHLKEKQKKCKIKKK